MLWLLLAVPAAAGSAAFFLPWNVPRRALLILAAVAHAGLTATAWAMPFEPVLHGWLALDAASLLFLSIASTLFLAAAVYAVGYLRQQATAGGGGTGFQPVHQSGQAGGRVENASYADRAPAVLEDATPGNSPEAVFTGCLLLFLASMTLVVLSRHLGLMWVAVEATTLASAPLICFHRHSRSLEATWKYLLICSVGIALALLSNFFLSVAARGQPGAAIRLTIDELLGHANGLNPMWLKAAFLLLLVGYGTKMGLAPLHTWLPDAHSEAPSVVSALLSGALLNCAFLPILRLQGLLSAAGLAAFGQDLLVLFGLFSMGVAAVFIIGQSDFKRMLAYSSVEHMGVLAFGIGIGGAASFGSLLHAVNHSLTKAMLFLAAGNILAAYRTKSTDKTRGVLQRLPGTGVLWIAGFLAIGGSPPFGTFLSELTILQGAMAGGHVAAAAGYLVALAVIFVGLATIVLRMAYGAPEGPAGAAAVVSPQREPLWSLVPPAALGLAVLVLGVYIPPDLSDLLHRAAAALGAS